MNNSIIVVDDERDFLESVRRGLITSAFRNVEIEEDPRKAAGLFEGGQSFDVALIDITMRGMDGIELLEIIKRNSPDTECIMVTAVNEASVAVECMKKGAYDYIIKPITREDLVLTINRALERKRLLGILDLDKRDTPPQLTHPEAFKPIITRSRKVIRVLKEAELHADSNVPILITGESGTGKELLARAIHVVSPRKKHLFSPINMASLTGNLFDAEFFGHTKGAFTGAEKDRIGYLEHTDKGTLFLDEVGNLPLELQGKLLRALQEGEFIRLGTSRPQKADVRFIAATNIDLDRSMAKGHFRKDLYYRLKGAWLHLPPLRERREDIPLLVNAFLDEFCDDGQNCGIDDDVMALLQNYNYPGNIRELRSILQSAVNLSRGEIITVHSLPKQLRKSKSTRVEKQEDGSTPIIPLAQVEKTHVLNAYQHTGRNKSEAARLLGIGLNTLRRKLESYGVG